VHARNPEPTLLLPKQEDQLVPAMRREPHLLKRYITQLRCDLRKVSLAGGSAAGERVDASGYRLDFAKNIASSEIYLGPVAAGCIAG
jgi:hypothetical protein